MNRLLPLQIPGVEFGIFFRFYKRKNTKPRPSDSFFNLHHFFTFSIIIGVNPVT